jgi:SAM-dependent methyltransferase
VDALEVTAGQRVLDLGCGTGQVTARLLAAGAEVVAVDALPEMLAGARRRASAATLVCGDVNDTDVGGGFDRVVLSFVLHNFDATGRVRLLRRAATALTPGGRIGVLDWALPTGRPRRALWRRFLTALEPSPTVPELLNGDLDSDIAAAGLQILHRRPVAGGRAQLLILDNRPPKSADNQQAIVTELGRWPLDGSINQEARLLTVEHPPGVHTPPHRHPGWLIAYVLCGPVISHLDGEPPRTHQTDEWWHESRGRLHLDAGNDHPDKTSKILVFTVTETGQPILVPEPKAPL